MSDDEQRVYVNVDGLLGFEIGAVGGASRWSGPMLQRIEAQVPASRLADIPAPPARKPHSTPSHGINITPDQKEVWMVDGVYGYVYVFDITSTGAEANCGHPVICQCHGAAAPRLGELQHRRPLRVSRWRSRDRHEDQNGVARIPTTEKLIEIDFDGTRAVAAGRR